MRGFESFVNEAGRETTVEEGDRTQKEAEPYLAATLSADLWKTLLNVLKQTDNALFIRRAGFHTYLSKRF
ncbi:MAG: hypothetical protein QXO30_05695 [Candidatus Caldarchaeum sp.]